MSSEYEVPVVPIKKEAHPNADTLSIVRVFGWQVVVKTSEWEDGDLAAYVRPDSVVPHRPEWHWLQGLDGDFKASRYRIRVRKFRKEWSHGVLVKIPEYLVGLAYEWKEGDNLAEVMGIKNYEPPSRHHEGSGSREKIAWWRRLMAYVRELAVRPRGSFPYYDVEHLRRFPDLIREGEEVVITEKVHGANALYTWRKPWIGRSGVYMRSRTVWKWPMQRHWWSAALEATPQLVAFLKAHPGDVVYGEVYGSGKDSGLPDVQDLTYRSSCIRFVAFDIRRGQEWVDAETADAELAAFGVPRAPILYRGPFNMEAALGLAEGDSTLCPGQMAEGVTVKTAGRHRRQLKAVSSRYLEKCGGEG